MHKGKDFYITTPIYYVNDVPHIGHAYTSLICDVMARFIKLDGQNVKFVTGTDEHGQKVEKAAAGLMIPPHEFTDLTSASFKQLAKIMDFQYDDFIRTTEQRHEKAVTALWNLLCEKGDIYLGSYSGWYSIRDEAFYQEQDLVNGAAPTGAPVEWIEEPSYFFRLSKWQEKLLELYENQPDFIFPSHRRNEVISFVKSGLTDLSISRTSFSWGIKVPNNNDHVIYVWIDALTNYLTLVGFPDVQNNEYKKFWAGENSFSIHIIGKDILRFHAIYWPAILLAAGLPLPKQIAAHGWWLNEGQKISKSIGNTIDPISLTAEFGVDQVRYFLLKEVAFGNDGNFSRTGMIKCINSLANNIGNLIQRTIAFIHREYAGVIPKVDFKLLVKNEALPNYTEILNQVQCYLFKYEFNNILSVILGLASQANSYIDQSAPWKLRNNPELMNAVIYKLLESIRIIGILLQPVTPNSANAILDQLQIPNEERNMKCFANKMKTDVLLPVPRPIFSKFE